MALSVSSDGNYAISTDMSRHAVLWNIKDKTHKVLASGVNIYSAYFIKNTHNFIYQNDSNNKVIISNINGQVIKKINPGFPTYGNVITKDLSKYFASDQEYNVFKITKNQKQQINVSYCRQDHKGILYSGPATSTCMDFIAAGKMLNLTLSRNEKYLIGSGFDNVYIWNTNTGFGKMFGKNASQTFATISPDNKYVISGDAANRGLLINITGGAIKWFKYKTPSSPIVKQYFTTDMHNRPTSLISVKYIDSNNVIAVFNGIPKPFNYAVLYNPKNIHKMKKYYANWIKNELLPTKYIPLLTPNNPDQPYPATQSFVRDQAIDTSPSAHILVMAQAHNNGILVYKYNPKTQTLKQIWTPVIKTPWWHIW